MKSSKAKNHASKRSVVTNPRIEKRRRLRKERRNEQFIHLWRLILFGSMTYGLGLLVINNGWASINVKQIHVIGSPKINANTIMIKSGLNFPMPLFSIKPKQLEDNLIKELPIKSVSIRRQLIPPSLSIILKERQPIAFADRRLAQGKETGMIDIDGNWMPKKMSTLVINLPQDLYIEGWRYNYKEWISKILHNKEKLGSPLRRVIINQNGELTLKTEVFEKIYLGTNSINYEDQVKAINKLSNDLTLDFIDKKGAILDIRDPSKPEFQIIKTKRSRN